jgi:hypothetical protein
VGALSVAHLPALPDLFLSDSTGKQVGTFHLLDRLPAHPQDIEHRMDLMLERAFGVQGTGMLLVGLALGTAD